MDDDVSAEDLPTEENELADLDRSNGQRIQALMGGKFGVQIQFPPGMWENMRLAVFLEHLLMQVGALAEAKLDFAHRVAEILGAAEDNAKKAALTAGVEQALQGGIDLGKMRRGA
jgi:hypothetical protein